MELPLSELAVRFGCELRGDPALRVRRVATLAGAARAIWDFSPIPSTARSWPPRARAP